MQRSRPILEKQETEQKVKFALMTKIANSPILRLSLNTDTTSVTYDNLHCKTSE